MGGLLKACGCFDGPWSEDDSTLVSVRCDEHVETDPPLDGYTPMRRDAAGVAVIVRAASELRNTGGMAIPRGKRKRRRR